MIFETEAFRYCSQLISKFETNGFATQLNPIEAALMG
jgi:hypothetical protein